MKIENEDEQREINIAMWALNGLWQEHHRLERGVEEMEPALRSLKDGELDRVVIRFALEWLEDAFSMFQGVYLTIGEEIESITEAFYKLGFVPNVFLEDLYEDDPRWRGVWEGDRNT